MMAGAMAFAVLASLNLNTARQQLNELASAQLDRLDEIMGFDHNAYIVTKSLATFHPDKNVI